MHTKTRSFQCKLSSSRWHFDFPTTHVLHSFFHALGNSNPFNQSIKSATFDRDPQQHQGKSHRSSLREARLIFATRVLVVWKCGPSIHLRHPMMDNTATHDEIFIPPFMHTALRLFLKVNYHTGTNSNLDDPGTDGFGRSGQRLSLSLCRPSQKDHLSAAT